MSKNAFTEEQSKEIEQALSFSSDVERTLGELAEKYFKEPKNIKNFLAKKYPKEYNEWFGTSVKEPSLYGKKIKLNELVERLLAILDYPEEKQEKVRIYMKGRAFPYEFAESLYVQLVENKIADLVEQMKGHYERCQESRDTLRKYHLYSVIMTIFLLGMLVVILYQGPRDKGLEMFIDAFAMSFLVTVPYILFWIQRKLFKRQNEEYEQLHSVYRKYKEIRETLPNYIIFENLREYWLQAEEYNPDMLWHPKKPSFFKFKR